MQRISIIFLVTWFSIFLVLFSLPIELFPEKWAFDSLKISGEIPHYDIEGSFKKTRDLLYFAGSWSASLITFTVALGWLYIASIFITSLPKFMLVSFFIVPLILLNLLWPAKETIVMLLVLAIVFLWLKFRVNLLASIIILYVIYGIFFRTYYLLILFVFLFLSYKNYSVLYQKNRIDQFGSIQYGESISRFFLLVFFLVVCFALPDSFYSSSQGQRDISNAYALLEGSYNKSSFNNISEVGRGIDFFLNYGWSAINLFLPFTKGFSVNQFLLFFFNVATFLVIYFRFDPNKPNVFLYLYCSHISVLLLFEPDQGSYFRHILSVSLYLMPLLGINAVKNKD
jgi:hypothetical protein